MNKKGISTLIAVILLILIITASIGIVYNIFKSIIDKQNCFPNYAKYFCIKNNMAFYKADKEAETITCWTNKIKGETKTFYGQRGVCE